eukprot:g1466.t1
MKGSGEKVGKDSNEITVDDFNKVSVEDADVLKDVLSVEDPRRLSKMEMIEKIVKLEGALISAEIRIAKVEEEKDIYEAERDEAQAKFEELVKLGNASILQAEIKTLKNKLDVQGVLLDKTSLKAAEAVMAQESAEEECRILRRKIANPLGQTQPEISSKSPENLAEPPRRVHVPTFRKFDIPSHKRGGRRVLVSCKSEENEYGLLKNMEAEKVRISEKSNISLQVLKKEIEKQKKDLLLLINTEKRKKMGKALFVMMLRKRDDSAKMHEPRIVKGEAFEEFSEERGIETTSIGKLMEKMRKQQEFTEEVIESHKKTIKSTIDDTEARYKLEAELDAVLREAFNERVKIKMKIADLDRLRMAKEVTSLRKIVLEKHEKIRILSNALVESQSENHSIVESSKKAIKLADEMKEKSKDKINSLEKIKSIFSIGIENARKTIEKNNKEAEEVIFNHKKEFEKQIALL